MNLEGFARTATNTYFKRTLIIFGVIFMFGILFSSTLLTHEFKEPLYRSVSEAHIALLNQFATSADMQIIKQANDILSRDFTRGTSSSRSNDAYVLYSDFFLNESSLMQLYNLCGELFDRYLPYDFIYSIDLFNENTGVKCSSGSGVTFTANGGRFCAISDAKLATFKSSDNTVMWICPEKNAVLYPEDSIITLLAKRSFGTPQSPVYGFIAINIRMNSVISSDETLRDDNTAIMVINSGGEVIAASSELDLPGIGDAIQADGGASGMTSLDSYSVAWVKSSLTDWIYLSVTPSSRIFSEISRITRFNIIFIAFVLLAALFAVYFAARYLQKPLRALLARSDADAGGDEFAQIDNIINRLSARVDNLSSTLDKSTSLIQNQITLDILNGNFSDADEIKSRFALINIDYSYKYYGLIFTKMNSVLLGGDAGSREIAIYEILNYIDEFWNKFGLCTSVRYGSYIISVLATDRADYLNRAQISCLRLPQDINLCLCDAVDDIRLLRRKFANIDRYMQYSFIYGYGNVFTDSDIERYEQNTKTPGDDLFAAIGDALAQNRIDDTKTAISDAVDRMKQAGLSYAATHTALLQIISVLCSEIHRRGFGCDSFTRAEILSGFNACETLDDFTSWVLDLLSSYGETLTRQSNAINAGFMDKIVRYIDENITSALTLKSVAEEFSISQSHLSKTFKEAYNINFSTYVIGKKFDYAARLLVEKENISIADIAESLGYYSITYFTQQFKQRFGVSPTQYRKINIKK